ncbi:hypothetical protein Raf01_83610 [Rugosimonospora africana]|uniref:Uncharacterized protein n=1 Tax=Rugosimonospora africana TaxID=556532 RepID=A0A8J3R1R4_9ACTN|nr:hypothetical protein Raf01_83610 [Rugosimonospora africana]
MVRQVVPGWFAEHGVDMEVALEKRGRDRTAHAAGGAEDRDLPQTGVGCNEHGHDRRRRMADHRNVTTYAE